MASIHRATLQLTAENQEASPSHTTSVADAMLARELETLCTPYVDAFFKHLPDVSSDAPRASLQPRGSTNIDRGTAHISAFKKSAPRDAVMSFQVPDALVHECSHLIDEVTSRTSPHTAAAPALRLRSAVELEAENAYLRALLSRMVQRMPATSGVPMGMSEVEDDEEPEAAPLSQLPSRHALHDSSPEHAHGDDSNSRRSPSAACPEPAAPAHVSFAAATHRALLSAGAKVTAAAAAGDGRDASPATALQVGELQEQIELLREAVRELSQQASVARGNSASPAPADIRPSAYPRRAISPSPRCATPTCTTDVPTLQRIILHQQQTIRTLQVEMEEVESARVQMERLLHLHEAAAAAEENADACNEEEEDGGVEQGEEEDEEDTPCLAATTHWRSTCNTEERGSGMTLPASPAGPPPSSPTTAARQPPATTQPTPSPTTVEEIYRLDYDAAAEVAQERRRAATYGGTRPPHFFSETTTPVEDAIELPGGTADGCDEDGDEANLMDDEPSSGMRTPLPRGTVVLRPLYQRFSSATGDSASVAGAPMEESPMMRPTKASFGTLSNRRTSAMNSFTAL